jgi:hypothetical protein
MLVVVAVVVAGTTAISLTLGALAAKDLARAVSVGYYVAGAGVLIGCFVLGSRGPLRADWGPEGRPSGMFLPQGVRRASSDERRETIRNSLLLFVFGIGLVALGAIIDPTRHLV